MHVNNTHLSLWNRHLPSQEEFSSMTWRNRLEILAWLGHLAPNTHNTQPWRFFCEPDSPAITIAFDHQRILPESDVVGRETIISLGCAMENIIVAARAYGLLPEIRYFPLTPDMVRPNKELGNGPKIITVAALRFSDSSPDAAMMPLCKAILTRKAMRTEFDPTKPIPEGVLEELSARINESSVELHLVSDSLRRLSISEFQGQADGYVLNSPRFARELGDWLLPNDTDSPVGMPGNTFGFDDVQAERIAKGLRGEGVLEPEDMLRFSLGGKIGFEKSPAIAFLTINKDDVMGWLAAGRAMERAFLILEREQISYAVHAAIVEVRLVNRIFAATLGTLKPLAAVFRIGYVKDEAAKAERPHSPRMPMESILLAVAPKNS